jgi:stearoyl-CoA desaturase (delta-9 desaturase)
MATQLGQPSSVDIAPIIDRGKMNWTTIIAMAGFHIGALAAPFFFSWKAVGVAIFLYWMTIELGISLGYHRLHTHRGYKAPRWMEYFFAICGALTLEGGPISWVGTHRIHHQKSDQPGDPHSPRDGAWWAHIGWILVGEAMHNNTRVLSKFAPDLAKQPFYVWLNNYHWVPVAVLGVVLYLVGGLPMLLWALCVRTVLGLHATWLVNSATHIWGKRRFDTTDDSRNNWWVAALTFGEGWHNNHHAHPASARHGLAWYEFDPSWWIIRGMEKLGIVSAVRAVHLEGDTVQRRAA